jgi:hypothetical protein
MSHKPDERRRVSAGDDGGRDEPRSSISNAITRVKRELVGRGPSRARTNPCGELIVCVLNDGLTPIARALNDRGRGDLGRRQRDAMAGPLVRRLNPDVGHATGAQPRRPDARAAARERAPLRRDFRGGIQIGAPVRERRKAAT